MSYVAVLPSIYPLWTGRCVATMSADLRRHTVVVDNTVENLGVAASWNKGIDWLDYEGVGTFTTDGVAPDWVVIVSAAVRFGPNGGADFVAVLDDPPPDVVAVEAGHGVGWHLIAFPRKTIETVGRFDPIFWPAYYEDIDYGRRVSLAFGLDPPYWHKTTDIDVSIAGFAHGIDLGKVHVDNARNRLAYQQKWGGDKGQECFETPYGEPGLSLAHTGGPPA